MYVHETGLCNLQVYPNGTVGNKGHVSIFLENKSEEPLHISEVVFTFQASGAAPLTWNAPKKELESEDDWGFQRLVGVNIETKGRVPKKNVNSFVFSAPFPLKKKNKFIDNDCLLIMLHLKSIGRDLF